MRFGLPERPAEVVASVYADLARAAFEFRKTFERALSASAIGPPGSLEPILTTSSTKNCPLGVGVEGLPTTAAKLLAFRPFW